MKNEKLITEELSKIQKLINYDTSKTNKENKVISEIDISSLLKGGGDSTTSTAAKIGGGILGMKILGGLFGGGGSAAATTGTFLGLGPVGWTILGVAGLAALGTWAYTKDSDIDKIRTIFNMCKTSPDRDKWKKFMSESEIQESAKKLFHAMDDKMFGLSFMGYGIPQTDEDAVYGVMKSFKSPGDFCAVSNYYEKTYKNSLMEDLDGDFDYGWEEIATPLVKMIEEYAKNETKDYCETNTDECQDKLIQACFADEQCKTKLLEACTKTPEDEVCKKINPEGKNENKTSDDVNKDSTSQTYFCDNSFSLGCKDTETTNDVKTIQKCLGVKETGLFDEETKNNLENNFGKSEIKKDEISILCGDF
jgi:hypothetical protein